MPTSWPRSPSWHLQCSRANMMGLHQPTQCCRYRHGYNLVRLWLNDGWNLECGHPILPNWLTEVVSRVLPLWLRQFVIPYLLLPISLYSLLYAFGDCAHHPAGVVNFAQLAPLCIFQIIVLIFSILLIAGNCKIAQTVSHRIQHLPKLFFQLSGCQCRLISISHIFLLLVYCCLCIFIWLSGYSGFYIHIILDAVLFLIIA